MTAPTTPQRDLDAIFGPVDAATQAWIDADLARYKLHRRRVADACAGRPTLQIGIADYGQVRRG